MHVDYQRRSGDSSTFFGNTILNMAVTLALYDIDTIALALFAGDDSVIFGKDKSVLLDRSMYFASHFNMECKLLNYYYPYFCSKFLVSDGKTLRLVPDPLKLLTKFGRLDLVNWDHVEDYRVSCCDLITSFRDATLLPQLSQAITERYNSTISDHSEAISMIHALVTDKIEFATLYEHIDGRPLCMDPTRRRLD
jgi:hypothetical protein